MVNKIFFLIILGRI